MGPESASATPTATSNPGCSPTRLLILGRQGSGKGTQCARLAARLHLRHISSGDVLRRAIGDRTELGRAAEPLVAQGALVPDSLVLGMILEELQECAVDGAGFVLDGFPRNRAQAEALFNWMSPLHVDAAVNIDVPAAEIMRRLGRRVVCILCGTTDTASAPERKAACNVCGGEAAPRSDDVPNAIRRRLALYEEQTQPLLTWLAERKLLVEVAGVGPIDEVEQRLYLTIRHLVERPVDTRDASDNQSQPNDAA